VADGAHDDWLAETFTQFRTEVREESRPPGTPAVRHAVRRRRGVRVSAVAVAVALVAAVMGIVATVHRPDSYPPLSAAQLKDLENQAFQALETGPGPFQGGLGLPITAATRSHTYSMDHAGSSPMRFARGEDYDLVAQCAGRGTVVVAWQAPGGVTGHTTVVCGGAAFRVHFVPQSDVNVIHFTLTPDADATSRAAIVIGFVEYQ
jgi:hypothetical protein